MEIKQNLITCNFTNESQVQKGTILHSTANPGATARNNRDYFNNPTSAASAHAIVDWNEILQCVPWNLRAWHACFNGNHSFIGVELCEPKGHNVALFNKVWINGVWLFAYILTSVLKVDKVTKDNLMSHAEVTAKWHESNHTDPVSFFASYGKTVDNFREDVQKLINSTKPLTWQEIISKVTSSPADWQNAINTAMNAAKADGNLGALETFQYLPDLILKIYQYGKDGK